MKRIFTSFALLCATLFTLNAQDCAFQFRGKALADGETVVIEAEKDPIFGDLECNTNPAAAPSDGLLFVNRGGASVSGSATITISEKTMSTTQIQWCMGGSCEIVKSSSMTKSFTTAAGKSTPVQYDCIVEKEGEMTTKLVAKVGSKTYTVNIIFTTNAAHISDTSASATPVAYYTLDGRQVAQRPRGLCLVKFSDGRVRKVVGK